MDKIDLNEELNGDVPRHVAIIMDGNGRWAKNRRKQRISGHRAGVDSVREIVKVCGDKGIECLTLFAFSSENWRRPGQEVGLLMELFLMALQREAKKLHGNNVRLRVIGDRARFSSKLQKEIAKGEELTRNNDGLTLVVAANYGGRWDISQAVGKIASQLQADEMTADQIEALIQKNISLADLPEPDLFIRTGGEKRISNFLLWQLTYTELYFTDILWPDFRADAFSQALASFAGRQRRFGRTSDQVEKTSDA